MALAPRLGSRDMLDKVALVIAFLAGSAGSWAAKILGLGPFVAAAWTVGAMAFYVISVTLLGRLRIEPEAIGDNCYYLGFLLTLSSLSATLYQLAQNGDQPELMRALVSGFGIALISTILGILLRVIFIQLRPDIVARDRETRIELQQAARELRIELSTSIATLKQFTTEAIQLASEQGARISESTGAVIDTQRSRMQSDVDSYTAMLRATLDEAGAQSVRTIGDNVTLAAAGAQDRIRRSLDEIGAAIAAFSAARAAEASQAAEVGDHAMIRAAQVAEVMESLATRTAASLAEVSDALAGAASAIEAAAARVRQSEAAADAARAAAERAAHAATRSRGWWPFRRRA